MALTQISTAGVKDDAVTSGKIPANAVGSSELADNAVDTAAIADDAVITAKIASSAVTATQIAAGAVTNAKLADNSVSLAKMQNNSVSTNEIADDAVTADKLANSINSAIAANTAKTSNATHTGDVTGSTSLTITSGAVTTAKIADSAITGAKMGNGSVGTTQLVDGLITGAKMGNGSVGTNQLVDQAVTLAKLPHGTSSQDGKFLRANNGADPTFETITGTTINNNADNRIITGSGTANTLEGEANATFNGDSLGLNSSSTTEINLQTSNNTRFKIQAGSNFAQFLTQNNNNLAFKHDGGTGGGTQIFSMNSSGLDIGNNKRIHIQDYYGDVSGRIENSDSGNNSLRIDADPDNTSSGTGSVLLFRTDGANRGSFTANGLCFNSDTAAANALDDYEEGTWTPNVAGNNSGTYSNRNGDYVKIGSFVHCNFYISVSNVSYGVSYFAMAGLPFAPAGDGTGSFMAKYHSTNNNRWFVLHTSSGSTTIYAYGTENGQTWEAMAADSTFEMIGTFTYKTNA